MLCRFKALAVPASVLALPSLVALLAAGAPAAARPDSCDRLTVRMIRGTGASLAGRTGPLVVLRSADADRMSLDCGRPTRMLFRAAAREPARGYFALIGLAAETLTGARPAPVEALALRLHRASLLETRPQEGRVGQVRLRCEPGDRPDGFSNGTLCLLERVLPEEPPSRRRQRRDAR